MAIDEESQNRLGKKWPWDRALLAEFLTKLSQGNPGVVVLDLVLSGASDPQHDQVLADAIRSGPPILLAAYLDKHGDPVLPNSLFLEAGGHAGMINKPRDIDLTVRKLFWGARLPMQSELLFASEIQAAAIHRKIPLQDIRLEPAAARLRLGPQVVPLEPPLGSIGINYLITPSQLETVSFWRVVQDQLPPDRVRGKIVLVGSTREITHDVYPTSLGLMAGVVINANGILTLMTGRFVQPLPLWLSVPLGFLFVLSILLMIYWKPPLWAGLYTAGLTLVSIACGFLALLWFNFRTESLSVVLMAGGAFLAGLTYKYLLLVVQALRLHRHVLTDSLSGAVTERYFRLRLDNEWPCIAKSRRPSSMLVIQMDPISVQLQHSSWPDVQGNLHGIVEALKQHLKGQGGLAGRLREDRFAVFLPGMDLDRAKAWTEKTRDGLQSVHGRLSFGLAATQQAAVPSIQHLLLSADAAAGRSWTMENRRIELYNPAMDNIVLPNTSGGGEQAGQAALDYVASELEDRNRAVEKALNDLRHAHKEIESHFLEVTKSLIMALETKDEYTAGHLDRVSRYATRLAEVLRLPPEEVEAIREAAVLHDIGKIGLPDEVLHKVGRLTDEEVGIIRQHLAIGAKILEPMKFFKPITSLIYHHHERYDGKGYPHGLTGEFIPPGAQVIAIADSFDAMTTNRGYNKPLNVQEALEELRKGSGTQFHPAYVEAFIQVVSREGPHLAAHTPHGKSD